MDTKIERDTAGRCEEIGELARKYLEDPHCDGAREIDRAIMQAMHEARWDDVSKWHRVRLRYLRFKKERFVAAQMIAGGTL